MKKRAMRGLIALTVLAMSIGLVGTALASPLAPQSNSGNAFGTYVNVAGLVQSGQTSPVGVGGCSTQPPPGFTKTNTTAAVSIPGVLQTGAIDTSVATGPAGGPASTKTTATISNVRALGGLVNAGAVNAVSTTSFDSTGYHPSAAGSGFVGLAIGGVPVLIAPAPNTTIALPGVGKVVLNEQITRQTSTGATMTVNMIDITLSTAQAGLPAGTKIVVGHASSSLSQVPVANAPTLRGFAYSASAHIGSLVTLGQEFSIGMCGNTGGRTITNSAATTSIPGILSTGTAANTVNGTIGATTSTSVSTATIQGLNLLSGLVSVDVIKAEANATVTNNAVSVDENGSTFTNLVVNGQTMPATVPPNTKISIGGITVWLNRVIRGSAGNAIVVRMIEITVPKANTFGLPIGADITVASASAGGSPTPTS